jgi:hypothetical protein
MCGVETALLSGLAAAGRILGSRTADLPVVSVQKNLFTMEESA